MAIKLTVLLTFFCALAAYASSPSVVDQRRPSVETLRDALRKAGYRQTGQYAQSGGILVDEFVLIDRTHSICDQTAWIDLVSREGRLLSTAHRMAALQQHR